jgi:hypothetical protein
MLVTKPAVALHTPITTAVGMTISACVMTHVVSLVSVATTTVSCVLVNGAPVQLPITHHVVRVGTVLVPLRPASVMLHAEHVETAV